MIARDTEGRPAQWATTREPEWDEIDRAMVDALVDYRNDLHVCGRPLSEALWDSDKESPEYHVSVEVCLACQALDKDDAERAGKDKAMRDGGRNPEGWRVKTIYTFDELDPEVQRSIRASQAARKNPTPNE